MVIIMDGVNGSLPRPWCRRTAGRRVLCKLRDIHYVLAAADEGSFSKAAVKVHVSQPALSQLIQRLEDELGVKLFVRKSNRVTLNRRETG